jgi:ATP-dependent exoDNAse (exonuclease V) alpha subunit
MTKAAAIEDSYVETMVTPEFGHAFDLLENTTQNIFLTGKAGTGKSTFLQYFRENTEKQIAVVAPTGVAALNVSGQTIHSLFRLSPRFVDQDAIKYDRRKIFKELELLIIDEISMVRADVFDGINRFLQLARKNNEPFGGVQICAIGDLFQLPPIVSNEEKEFFAQYYSSPFFFATKSYESAKFQTIQFSTIHRQNDAVFINILNAIRSGNCNKDSLAILESRVKPKATPAQGTLVLTTTNALAENINSKRLAQLTADIHIYNGEIKGEFGMKGARLPSPEQLELKVGAQVMFVKNDSDGRWVNGTIGIVESLADEEIKVRVGDIIHDVEQEKWKTIGYEFSEIEGKILEKTLGSYAQFPLMLAWAVTIHKSQGKTLDRVIIDLGSGAFAAGQLYVALSRCRTLSGIALKQPVTKNDIRCDASVTEFMQQFPV